MDRAGANGGIAPVPARGRGESRTRVVGMPP